MSVLKIDGLSKRFGEKVAVDAISFQIDSPGVMGLIGTNGAGKTTTIRMILGILEADEGSATWNGAKITRESVRFGYLPEERGIYPKTKVIDQLTYFGELRGMTHADAKASSLRLMERLEVTEYTNMTADKLSKGNQQKIQLIAAMIHDPELIILDEPFSGLDPVNTEMLRAFITELAANNKYILMSSHQMSTVEEFSRDLVMLHNGKTILQGNLKQIKAGYGHTNLVVRADQDIRALAEELGLQCVRTDAQESEFKISGDEDAKTMLMRMTERGIIPVRFEIREPSLHEIFLEKVGHSK